MKRPRCSRVLLAALGVLLSILLPASTVGAASQASAAPQAARSATPQLDIQEIRLENGLRIFVLERTASPTFAAVYVFGVGGAMDPKGRSGIAHLLEHMMFKGTRRIGSLDAEKEAALMERISALWHELHIELDKQDDPFRKPDTQKIEQLRKGIESLSAEQKNLIAKNEYGELVTRAGGVGLNAMTDNDRTRYLVQLPSNRLELYFRLESDRLLNPVFREFYSERDVVQAERRQSRENTPGGLMREAIDSLMFPAHPYGTPVIGWPKDLQRLTREDAMAYFTTYYSPSNCVMVIAGDVTAADVERLARQYFSPWKRQEIPRLQITAEPEQKGERRRIVEFDAEPRVTIGWATVPEGHPDHYPLTILASILGGLWSSRMDKAIVQADRIADSVYASHYPMRREGQFTAGGTVREGHTIADLEAAIDREIVKIQTDGVRAEELERAKIGTEISRVARLKSNIGQAFRIADAVSTSGGIGYIREYEERVNAVTADQVRDAAKRYFTPARRCVVELRTVKSEGASPSEEAQAAHQRGGAPGARGEKHSAGFAEMMGLIQSGRTVTLKTPEIGKDVDRVKLPSGITVFIKEDHSAPSIEMQLEWLGGANTTPVERLASFEIASQILNEGGTDSLDPMALTERKEDLGTDFGYWIGEVQSEGSFWSLKRNFRESFDLALDILMRPRLDAKRLETIKGQYIERMRRRGESPGLGGQLIQDWVFVRDHPRLGYVASRKEIESVTPDQIRAIWQRYIGRDNLFITAVGDFEKKEILGLIEEKFGPWRKAEDKQRKFITRDPVIRPGVYLLERDFPQPAVNIAHMIKVDRTAPEGDHAAIEILNDILGGSGFRSRLMERLRSDEGLTYGISSFVDHQGRPGQPGMVGVSYLARKGSVARSIDDVVEEFRKIIDEKVSSAEVAEQIDAWRNNFIFRYTNDFYIVSRLMGSELDDRPYDHDRRVLESVQKVTAEDVQSAARKYLRPENLTISIYGTLSDEERTNLRSRFGLRVLRREDVFRGGYESEAESGS